MPSSVSSPDDSTSRNSADQAAGHTMTFTIHGISASKGIAIGRVYTVDRGRPEATERRLEPSLIEAEVERFDRAVDAARLDLRAVKARIPEGTPKEIERRSSTPTC